MTTTPTTLTRTASIDSFGRAVAARLSSSADELPYEITERLRAARMQAVAQRRRVQLAPARGLAMNGGAAALSGDDEGLSLWARVLGALPILALAAGLVLLHGLQAEKRASELAEVDVQLLTDDLPPAAYADPGFVQFLKSGRGAAPLDD